MIPQNRSSKKKQRVLIARPCSLNLLSGNVSSPSFSRVPLVTNTTRLPLVTGGVPFSLSRGAVPGWKQMRGNSANGRMLGDFSEEGEGAVPGADRARQVKGCPWCGGNDVRTETKSGKRALWACLNCHRRWWASLDDPAKLTRARPRLGQKIFKRGVWHMFGGFGP